MESRGIWPVIVMRREIRTMVVAVVVVAATIVAKRATSRGIARKVVAVVVVDTAEETMVSSATGAVVMATLQEIAPKVVAKGPCATSARALDTLPISALLKILYVFNVVKGPFYAIE